MIVFGTIVLLFAAYYAYWQYQYRQAETAATDFCARTAVGSDIADTIARVDSEKGRRALKDENRYVVFFPGPIFNAFECEIEHADRKVVTKKVTEPRD